MATAFKILGQVNPSATTASDLYTVGAGKETVVSTITVCNQGSSSGTYRIAVRENGDTLATKHYIFYDVDLAAKATDTHTLGLTLNASDIITIYASTANFSFNAYGSEKS